MRRTTMFMSAAALVVSAATAFAQAPNLSGKWVLQVDPAAAAAAANAGGGRGRGGGGGGGGGGRGGLGAEATITQDAKTLTVTRTTPAGETKTVYNLDGSESKNSITMGANTVEQVSKAKWDGAKLVVVTTGAAGRAGGTPMETTMTLSLDASGNLVVATTRPGRGGGDPMTTTQTYKKG